MDTFTVFLCVIVYFTLLAAYLLLDDTVGKLQSKIDFNEAYLGSKVADLVSDTNRELSKVALAMTTQNGNISGIQGKYDKLKNAIDEFSGDSMWSVEIEGKKSLAENTKYPTIAERLASLEKYLGIEFTHTISEDRGYMPNTPFAVTQKNPEYNYVGSNDNCVNIPEVKYADEKAKKNKR